MLHFGRGNVFCDFAHMAVDHWGIVAAAALREAGRICMTVAVHAVLEAAHAWR